MSKFSTFAVPVRGRNVMSEIYAHARRSDGEVGRISLTRDDCREVVTGLSTARKNAETWGIDHGISIERERWQSLPWWRRLFPTTTEDEEYE